MTLLNYLSYFDELIQSTESLFRTVPPDKLDWKPTEKSFTIGQQMAHIVGAIEVYGRGLSAADWGFTSMRERFVQNRYTPSMSAEDAVTTLHKNAVDFRTRVGALTEEEFNSGEVDAPQFGKKMPRWRIAMLAVEHHNNHKTELFMYLKIIGMNVNTGHLYRG
jgi:uncharacterized damage-inducible protein DinB